MKSPDLNDRVAARARPQRAPIMHQTWGKLLFLHWSMAPAALRRLVPESLEIDTFEGEAWVGVTPFTMWGVRPAFLPAMPLLSRTHELNVRTYVHRDGVPGVWFLSLEAANPMAVLGARIGFHLPYFQARMKLEEEGESIRYSSHRTHPGAPPADFEVAWRRGGPLPAAEPGTREFFLIERYCLYSEYRARLSRCRIYHRPWPLRVARLDSLSSTLLEAHGLATQPREPLLHAQGAPLEVEIFAPEPA
jgi:uncharacterized protein YqjF (DUF2071 family)